MEMLGIKRDIHDIILVPRQAIFLCVWQWFGFMYKSDPTNVKVLDSIAYIITKGQTADKNLLNSVFQYCCH